MRKITLLSCPIITLLLCLNATAQINKSDSLYLKAYADTMAKYIPPKPRNPDAEKAAEERRLAGSVEIDAKVDIDQWRQHLEKSLLSPINKAARKGMKPGYYIVLVRFLVEKDGSISDVTAMNDPGYGLVEASVKVLKTGPLWSPGFMNGKPVRSYHTQPITFLISEK